MARALAALACLAAAAVPSGARGESPAAARARYSAGLSQVEATRKALAARFSQATWKERPALRALARAELLAAFDRTLFPAWTGTRWDFYGTTETPGEGTIACGYYVTTLLRHAGVRVERVRLAQQASERIVRTLAGEDEILRFRDTPLDEVVRAVRQRHGEGLYVVGMDYHVGFLRLTTGEARHCHSASLEPAQALCEDATSSAGLASRYHVVGPALSDVVVDSWLLGRGVTQLAPGGANKPP